MNCYIQPNFIVNFSLFVDDRNFGMKLSESRNLIYFKTLDPIENKIVILNLHPVFSVNEIILEKEVLIEFKILENQLYYAVEANSNVRIVAKDWKTNKETINFCNNVLSKL